MQFSIKNNPKDVFACSNGLSSNKCSYVASMYNVPTGTTAERERKASVSLVVKRKWVDPTEQSCRQVMDKPTVAVFHHFSRTLQPFTRSLLSLAKRATTPILGRSSVRLCEATAATCVFAHPSMVAAEDVVLLVAERRVLPVLVKQLGGRRRDALPPLDVRLLEQLQLVR